jgi:imidazolonepropionase
VNGDIINKLANSQTIGTLLPTAAFFLRMLFQPARQMIDAGCAIALASDYIRVHLLQEYEFSL